MTNEQNGGRKPPVSLIVDARNALYRCIYAHQAELNRGKKKEHLPHPLVIFMRQMDSWNRQFKPSSVHIMWDAPRSEVWRRKIYPSYKARENNQYVVDISEELKKCTEICESFFSHLNVRQYYKRKMEADDLIYALVSVLHPNPTVIVSTDSDMVQIPFRFNTCTLYEPRKEEIVIPPTYSPTIFKALKGDKADHIAGYRGIGPKKALKLTEDIDELYGYLKNADCKIYYRNLLLIDLSLCPKLLSNIVYVQRVLSRKTTFNKLMMLEDVQNHKISGMLTEFQSLTVQFSSLR